MPLALRIYYPSSTTHFALVIFIKFYLPLLKTLFLLFAAGRLLHSSCYRPWHPCYLATVPNTTCYPSNGCATHLVPHTPYFQNVPLCLRTRNEVLSIYHDNMKSRRGRSGAPAELHAPWQTVVPTMYSGSPGTKTIHSPAQSSSVPQRCRTRSALATVPRCVTARPSFTMAQVAERVIYAPSQPYNLCAERPAVFKFTSVESAVRSVLRCTLRTERRTVNQSSKLANGRGE